MNPPPSLNIRLIHFKNPFTNRVVKSQLKKKFYELYLETYRIPI